MLVLDNTCMHRGREFRNYETTKQDCNTWYS